MSRRSACAGIDIKVLSVVLLIAIAAGISLVAARQVRRNMASETALEAGQAAYSSGDWAGAVKHWQIYLRHHPDDADVLRKYGESLLNTRPRTPTTVAGAMSAYNRVMTLTPDEDEAYERLAMLYTATKQYDSLAHVAQTRLQHVQDDPNASLWLAQALIGQEQREPARQILKTLIDKLEARPRRHSPHVYACVLMSGLVGDDDKGLPRGRPAAPRAAGSNAETDIEDPNSPKTPLEWLDRAVAHDPCSVEALIARARLCRLMADNADPNMEGKQDLMRRAREDLEAAEALESRNPNLLYALGGEWVLHDDLDHAEGQLKAIDALSTEIMGEYSPDPNDWRTLRFLFVAELATKKKNYDEAAGLGSQVLELLTEHRHRLRVLPALIDLHLAAGRMNDANDCLARYTEALRSSKQTGESLLRLASYQARVAIARGQPYEAIDTLGPIVQRERSNPEIWQLCDILATAYQQTRQTSRAVDTWTQCLALLQRQPRLTEAMARSLAEIRRQLPAHYAALGDWQRVLALTGGGAGADPNTREARVLRIGAVVSRMVRQGEGLSPAQLAALHEELGTLRKQDPNDVRVRILQATLWDHQGQVDRAEAELKQGIAECTEPLAAETELVRLCWRAGRRAEAIAVCRRAVERHADVAGIWGTLSELHENTGDHDAARRCLEEGFKSVEDKPGRDSLSIRLARLDLIGRDTREAGIARLMELAQDDPNGIQVRSLLLTLKEIQADPNVADRLIADLRRIEGQSGLTWRFHQASVWFSDRNWRSKQQEIVDMIRYCIEADPRSTAPVLLLGRVYEDLGNLRSAEGVYRQALTGGPSAPEVAEGLANLLIAQGRQAEAVEILPSISPVRRPYVLERAGDFSRAIAGFRRRVESDVAGTDAESRVRLARLLYEQTKDAQGALRYLDEGKRIDPNSQTQIATRAMILAGEGRGSDARRVLDDYVAEHDTFGAHWIRAVYLAQHGELERAEEDFRKLITFAGSGAAGWELLADFYAECGRLDQAIQAVEEGTRAHPESLRLKRNQMQLLLQRGRSQDREKAREIRIALQKEAPDSGELMFYEAMEGLERRTPEALAEARQTLERAVKLNPLSVNAHLVLIDVLVRLRDFQAASEQATRAVEANPTSTRLRVATAAVELALGHGQTAFNLAGQILEDDPNNVDALTIAVSSSLASKDRRLQEQAGALIDGVTDHIRGNERLLIARARVHMALEQPRRAIPELETYCKTEPGSKSLPALLTLTDLYRNVGDANEADRTIALAEAVAPDRQNVIHARFLLRMSQNRLTDLEGVSSAYISATDQDVAIVLSAASRLTSLNTPESRREALRLFEHAATTWPKSFEARHNFGLVLYTMGEVQRAKQVYEGLLQEFPRSPQVLNDLAWILQEHDRDYERALDLANQGVRLSLGKLDMLDSHLRVLDTRATILKAMGRLTEAKKDYDAVRRLCVPQPEHYPRLAKTALELMRICVQQGELAEARQYGTSAQEIDGKIGVFTPEERLEVAGILQTERGK